MGLRTTDSDENRYPRWRTLQRAAVNFSSPFRAFAHCRLKTGSSTMNRAPRSPLPLLRNKPGLSRVSLHMPTFALEYAQEHLADLFIRLGWARK